MNNAQCNSAAPIAPHETFEDVVLPHLDAGRRLARWLIRNEHDAEDVVQEASLRAFRYFQTFNGGNGRAWFLKIVRNSCHGLHDPRMHEAVDPFDEQEHSAVHPIPDPEALLLQTDNVTRLEDALNTLPDRFREALVLRELEGFTYREMADALDVPMGTVMSTLSRARQALRTAITNQLKELGGSYTDYL